MSHPPPLTWHIAAFVLLAGIVVAPFGLSGVPAFGDTLNHLARMHVLASIDGSADLQRYYAVRWAPIPYLAMDAIVPSLARILPIYLAGKMFVCACVLMPAAAAVALHASVHRRLSLVPASGLLLCTNYLLALGFLNYLFASGLAVLLFAAWLRAQTWRRWRRAAAFAPLLTLLYLGHAFAALAYCLCVAGSELARACRAGAVKLRKSATDMAAAAAHAIPALLLAGTLHVGAGSVGVLETTYGDAGAKLMALASPILLLVDRVHLLTALTALAGLFLLRKHVRLSPAVWPAAAAVGVAAVAMPHVVASTWGMDLRLPLVAAILLIGSISVQGSARRRAPAIFAVFALLLATRAADDLSALRQIDRATAQIRQLLAHLPRGARLLVASTQGHGSGLERIAASTAWQMPLTAVIDRDAFVPYLFTGLSTVHVRPAYRLSSTPNGLPVTLAQLAAGATEPDDGLEHDDGHGAREYYRGWPAKFDFVLIQHDDPLDMLPPMLLPVAQSERAALYRIIR